MSRSHLTGDGGDEVFAGYSAVPRRGAGRSRCRSSVRGLAGSLLRAIPAGRERTALAVARRAFRPRDRRCRCTSASRAGTASSMPISKSLVGGPLDRSPAAPPRRDGRHDRPLAAQPAAARELLRRTCRTTCWSRPTAARWRTRSRLDAPFLDRALIEYVATLPDSLQARWRAHQGDPARRVHGSDPGRDRSAAQDRLRRAARRLVPRRTARAGARPAACPRTARYRDLHLRPMSFTGRCQRHQAGAANEGQRLWALLTFERWLQLLPTFLRGSLPSSPRMIDHLWQLLLLSFARVARPGADLPRRVDPAGLRGKAARGSLAQAAGGAVWRRRHRVVAADGVARQRRRDPDSRSDHLLAG